MLTSPFYLDQIRPCRMVQTKGESVGTARSSSKHFQKIFILLLSFRHKIPPLSTKVSFLCEFASKFASVSPSIAQNWQVR